MDEIINLIRDGNSMAVRSWLDCVENDFNQGDDHGFSLLHWACWDGHLNIVEMLVNKGAKLNSVNKCEDTPLHEACKNNHLNVALYLIKNKANINATNLHGNTPLHYACHFNYEELAFELVRYGSMLNLCNRYNQSPIDLCRNNLKQFLTETAKGLNLDLIRIPFREDSNLRLSRTKSKDASFTSQISVNIDELPVERMIDSNHGGTSWKGYWQGSEVVIKVLKLKESNQRIASAFNQEYKKLRIFNSMNILPVLGTCVSLPDLIVVSPYMIYGSLYSVLHEQKEIDLNFNQLIQIAIQISKGMEFLHNLDTCINNNFNLNSKHVMIDEDFTAKLNMADYRFSFSDKDRVYNPAWMAPEALKKRPEEINKKSADMWSFGVILWELFTKQIPFASYIPTQCGLLISRDSMRLEIPCTISPHVQKLIKICMNEDPTKRPKFEMILPILEKLKK